MDRIKNVMQRLVDVYQGRHPKTAIDIDLMLDYTRVMYADLLEWRKSFKDEPHVEGQVNKTEETYSREDVQPEPQQVSATPQSSHETISSAEEVAEKNIISEKEDVIAKEPETEKEVIQEEAVIVEDIPEQVNKPLERDEVPAKESMASTEPPMVTTAPEAASVNTLNKDTSGISFEPPVSREPVHTVKDELQIDKPEIQQQVEDIPLKETIPQQPKVRSSLPGSLFAIPEVKKDIRSSIGINDKYLFLNELFNNHKEDYEHALNQLNQMDNMDAAVSWIRNEIAPVYKWDKEDTTVETFYSLLSKHFSLR